jgi:hypothetical protein
VGWLSLSSSANCGDSDDDDEDDAAVCPEVLRPAFALLEQLGAKVEKALGLERYAQETGSSSHRLLTHKLGMVAVFDDKVGNWQGYARHKDNWRIGARHDGTSSSGGMDDVSSTRATRASDWRNFRVLTAILYLNAPDWDGERDGGVLRCFEQDGAGASTWSKPEARAEPVLEIVPRGGTIAIFPCCHVPHEVSPARRRRYALTLWFSSPALLRGTPEERATAAASALELRARRKRQRAEKRACDTQGGGDAQGAGDAQAAGAAAQHTSTHTSKQSKVADYGALPQQLPQQHTAELAATWADDAAAVQESEARGAGGFTGFSFGFS